VKFEAIPVEAVAVEAAEPALREEPSHIVRAPELVDKIRGLADWDDRADLRSRWILVPEESIVHSFGKPDFVHVGDGGEENWVYRVPAGTDEEGNTDWDDFTLVMNRGRLVRTYD
jgi:hypothetical protein